MPRLRKNRRTELLRTDVFLDGQTVQKMQRKLQDLRRMQIKLITLKKTATAVFFNVFLIFCNISVRAVNCIIASSVIPRIAFFNSVPPIFRAVKIYIFKRTAIFESTAADARYIIGYGYTRKRTAIIEHSKADARYIIGND